MSAKKALRGCVKNSTALTLINSLTTSERSVLLKRLEKEKLKRLLSSSLLEFTKHKFKENGEDFLTAEHHEIICDALDDVCKGNILNLLINVPPRYGKTELAVVNWMAQCLAINPKAKFIHLSFSDKLALDNSAKAREVVSSDWYQDFWPLTLKSDADSKAKWYTQQGGGVYATASGGAVTGFGAGMTGDDGKGLFNGAIIIDDPLKADDAQREGERSNVNNRLNNTIKSRRNSRHTPIIIIMQRLHEEDMSGFVLGGGMGEKFTHIKIPAIKEDGTALWPFKHTIEELRIEKKASPMVFSGQMMQDPVPEDGEFFKRDWFRRYAHGSQPEQLTIYQAADFAVSDGKGDYTEIGAAGFDALDNLYFLDWWSGRTTPDIWIEKFIGIAQNYKPVVGIGEGGPIRRSIEPFLLKRMRETRTYVRMEWISSNKDKAANARSFQALASMGKVYIPRTEWGDEVIEQLISFPGKYDDKVDVCGLFGRILDQTYSPSAMSGVVQQAQDDAYNEDDSNGDDEAWTA